MNYRFQSEMINCIENESDEFLKIAWNISTFLPTAISWQPEGVYRKTKALFELNVLSLGLFSQILIRRAPKWSPKLGYLINCVWYSWACWTSFSFQISVILNRLIVNIISSANWINSFMVFIFWYNSEKRN